MQNCLRRLISALCRSTLQMQYLQACETLKNQSCFWYAIRLAALLLLAPLKQSTAQAFSCSHQGG